MTAVFINPGAGPIGAGTVTRARENIRAFVKDLGYDDPPVEIVGDGDLEDDGVSYLAAHLLALAPSARDMRKGEKPGETMYGRERKILEAIVSSGFRTAGTSPYVPTEDV